MATVDSVESRLELSGDDLIDLTTGLAKLMAAYERRLIKYSKQNFN